MSKNLIHKRCLIDRRLACIPFCVNDYQDKNHVRQDICFGPIGCCKLLPDTDGMDFFKEETEHISETQLGSVVLPIRIQRSNNKRYLVRVYVSGTPKKKNIKQTIGRGFLSQVSIFNLFMRFIENNDMENWIQLMNKTQNSEMLLKTGITCVELTFELGDDLESSSELLLVNTLLKAEMPTLLSRVKPNLIAVSIKKQWTKYMTLLDSSVVLIEMTDAHKGHLSIARSANYRTRSIVMNTFAGVLNTDQMLAIIEHSTPPNVKIHMLVFEKKQNVLAIRYNRGMHYGTLSSKGIKLALFEIDNISENILESKYGLPFVQTAISIPPLKKLSRIQVSFEYGPVNADLNPLCRSICKQTSPTKKGYGARTNRQLYQIKNSINRSIKKSMKRKRNDMHQTKNE